MKRFNVVSMILLFSACCVLASCTEKASSIGTPLADTAFKAEITGVDPVTKLKASQKATYKIVVKNISTETWPAKGMSDGKYQINLGNHWLDKKGVIIINDQVRMPIPYDVKPGKSVQYSIEVAAPPVPGEYKLVFDMVQETVSWFEGKGSTILSYDVIVEK